ncbi:RagB/SusD family nutrient uptake outer membrane protein [Rubrolithibacter danxiaensis]|uniref:RagB/SusD family nutrient uptake outer membrane protein n=1 Tax=Rubrolithibacter danxiaensis TaxID=3390805 RepID=UPI003BF8EBF8
MKKIFISACFAAIIMQGCTKLDENIYDKYTSEEFYNSPQGSDVALAAVYAQIPGNWNGVGYAGADNGWYDLNSMSSDEQVVPHRNTGDWQLDFARLYLRQWLPSDLIVNNTWNWLYKSVFNANLAVEQLEKANAEPSKIAEAKVLRAFFYYLLMDDYGDVPFFTVNNVTVDKIPQAKRKDVFDFIVKELTDNIELLSPQKGGQYYGRFNKWAGYALLAKVYLNAEVYTGTPMWSECIEACNKIDGGGYSLHSGAADASNPLGFKYYELFGDVLPDDETILAIYTKAEVVGRNIFTVRSLGGSDGVAMLGYSAWNGAVVPKEYVEKFDDNDVRKRQFRYGSNPYGPKPAGFINYSLEVTNLDNPGAEPNAGARNQKFFPVAPMSSGGASNDFPIYRYADILLMKAECNVRLGNAGAAKVFIDQVRQRAGLSALTADPTLEDIYNERGFELNWEGHRRQDMIRFGKFLLPHGLAPAAADFRLLFPIPTSALDANPLLKQNPGY